MVKKFTKLLIVMAIPLTMISCGKGPQNFSEDLILEDNWLIHSSDNINVDGSILSSSEIVRDGYRTSVQIVTEGYWTSVPNTVLAALVRNGMYEDIFMGKNLEKVPKEQFQIPWWYRTTFNLEEKDRQANYQLVFEGINYKANIWLNGQQVADSEEVEGCFRVFEFNVTDLLRKGKNVLAVEIIPPVRGDLTIGFVDWNPWPPDNSLGLWRPVKLLKSGPVSMKNVFVKPNLDTETLENASLTISAELTNHSGSDIDCTIEGKIEDIEVSQAVSLKTGETRKVVFNPADYEQLNIQDPRIWWPNHLGDPEMYSLDIKVSVGQNISDEGSVRFGIRDIKDYINENGHRGYMINGEKVQIMGAGWVDDIFLTDPDEKVAAQLNYVKAMNLNTIRLEGFWGRNQKIYDMADENGIMVMIGWSCQWEWEGYCGRPEEEFLMINTPDEYISHSRAYMDQVKWLRNHPSIFLWVYGSDKLLQPELEKMLNKSIMEEDGSRPILGSCKYQESEVTGATAVKMLGPYHYVTPNYWYVDTENGGAYGFNTETGPGLQPPVLESIKKMIPEKDLWPMNDIWDYHTGRNEFASFELWINPFIGRYGESADVEEFAFKAQMSNYEAIRAMFEAFTVNKHNATGVIQWMLNSAFPNMLWQLYDWFLMPTGAYYGTRTALEPVNIVYNYGNKNIYVTNVYNHPVEDLSAEIRVFNLNSREVYSKTVEVGIEENSSSLIHVMPEINGLSLTYFIDLKLKDSEGKVLGSNFYWLSTKEDILDWENTEWHYTPNKSYADLKGINSIPGSNVDVTHTVSDSGEKGEVEVHIKNVSDRIAFFIELNLRGERSGSSILPVYWEDNYVTILPGEERIIKGYVNKEDFQGDNLLFSYKGWNVQ
jgi:exo-1,4-beta-D-glucosaminidase